METSEYLAHLATESQSFIDAALAAPDAAVPQCGDWTMNDLAVHTARVWTIATVNVEAASTDPTPPGDAPEGAPAEWLPAIRQRMLEVLGAADPAAPAWSFASAYQTAGFWQRRMTQETLVHRWDAQHAGGAAQPMDVDLARDGIDEYLSVGLRFSSARPDRTYPSTSLHLHCTDTDGEWMLVGNDGPEVTITHEHGKGDAAVRGTAEDLLLWIWNRPGGDVQIFGDEAVASTWQQLAP